MLGPLTGRIYIATRYRDLGEGRFEALEKFDVTSQFMAVKEESERLFDYTPTGGTSDRMDDVDVIRAALGGGRDYRAGTPTQPLPYPEARAALARLVAREQALTEALEEGHELVCGCDEPGRLDLCVGGAHYAALADSGGTQEQS
jgi:hypothetical protein